MNGGERYSAKRATGTCDNLSTCRPSSRERRARKDRRIDGVDDGTALAVRRRARVRAVKVRRLPSGIRCGDAARLAELERELGPDGDVLGFGPGDLPLGRDRRDNDRRSPPRP